MFRRLRLNRSKKHETQAGPVGSTHPDEEDSADSALHDWSNSKSLFDRSQSTSFSSSLAPTDSRRSPSPQLSSDALGLHVVHRPDSVAPVDIIFVHGLGGGSAKTWSKDHDTRFFWPGIWLPLDPEIGQSRIMTFGYNASFGVGASKSMNNITDFAKELLYEMGFSRDNEGGELEIGRVPIIFVAHSMGGLVVKRAYLLGQNDERYQNIVRSISGIVFLATPHRGTDLAVTLNRVLLASFQSPKIFIDELKRSSPVLEEINEQFRHIAPRLSIVSFYETLATQVGLTTLMILPKDSATLGYPQEISRHLKADHHDVCKYYGLSDPNYVTVRNMLKSLVSRFRSNIPDMANDSISDDMADVAKLLGTPSDPEEDFNFYQNSWMPGTCGWILEEPVMADWFRQPQNSQVVWLSAPPASGKSILSTFIINHLRKSGLSCQYFFFRVGDQSKRSLNTLLRSIAIQLAKESLPFRRSLSDLSRTGLRLEKADSTVLWKRLYESVLLKMKFSNPLFWIIDAVDESESPKALLDLFRGLLKSTPRVRLLFISRNTQALSLAVDRLSNFVAVNLIEKSAHDNNLGDIRTFVEQEIPEMRGSDELKMKVTQSIIDRAEGNFLWVRLVLKEIIGCHTEEAIAETLNDIPSDMNKFYERMEQAILNSPRKSDRLLAKEFLQWINCAHRSLNLLELSQALKSKFPVFLDLKRTIHDVCGQFVIVDPAGQIGMVHKTARDYLIKISSSDVSIDPPKAHEQLFMESISALLDPGLRLKLGRGQYTLRETEPFLLYAATSWAYHLKHADAISDRILDMLLQFFRGPSVLSWIHLLATIRQPDILVQASRALTSFVSTNRKMNAAKNPMLHRLLDLELLDQWIIDLVKIIAKFGRHLFSNPSAIYKLVPPFCPDKSILRREFYDVGSAEVLVSGISNENWNDNLVRISLPNNDQGWKIECAGQYVAVIASSGTVHIWSSDNFSEVCLLQHEEAVTAMCFNKNASELITYGLQSSKLWSIPSGQLVSSTSNPIMSRAMTISFSDNDEKVLSASSDGVIRYLLLQNFRSGWHVLNPDLLRETSQSDDAFVNSPMCIAFNENASQIGVSYRGFPLSVWTLDEAQVIGRCRRARRVQADAIDPSNSWFSVDRFTWNPVSGHIIGLYKDGSVFKWHPVTDENQEVQSVADEIAASSDGRLFATSSSNGTVKVWNFAYFSVIYQLSSIDLVTGLAFSPDSRRFYDIRGSSINAWESNSLIRFSESEESFSDATSEDQTLNSVSQVSEACLTQYEAISALSVAPRSSLYCVGNDEGIMDLYHTRTGRLIRCANFVNRLSVNCIVWSDDASNIACSDLGGDIIIKRLVFEKGSTKSESKPTPNIELEGRSVHQLVFSHDSRSLLIITDSRGYIWAINEGVMRLSTPLENGASRRWINHPTQQGIFLGFGGNDVKVYRWSDFAEHRCLHFGEDPQQETRSAFDFSRLSLNSISPQESYSTVSKAMITQDNRHVLIQVKDATLIGRPAKRLLVFDYSALEAATPETFATLRFRYIPPHIVAKVEIPLGILVGLRFVFLDQDLWVCTFQLGSEADDCDIKRHFFIPRDWANTEVLEQCCMMNDGTILCPRDDKVAVIRNSLIAGF